MDKKRVFEELSSLNVNEHTEKKEGLTYLTWSWAWDEIKRHYPEASYTIWKNDRGLPYVYDELTGFMVYTSVTIEGVTHEMWLPVMDSKNKAMKAEPYTYKTKYGEKTVEPATMFDINKTIMRCLVKNLAMFGLGLYIYAGEDLPENDTDASSKPVTERHSASGKASRVEEAEVKAKVIGYINRHKMPAEDIAKLCRLYKVGSVQELTVEHCRHYIGALEKKGKSIDE